MNCDDTNPCGSGCSDNCEDTNPCYEGCGCLNPTTFKCVTKPGTYSNIGITNDMDGEQVLAKINEKIGEIEDDIEAIDGTGSTSPDTKVSITSNDDTTGFLNDKVQNGTYVKKSIVNPGASEKLKFDVTPGDFISSDSDNDLTLGSDNKLKVISDGQTYIVDGDGVNVTGTGTADDPYVISTNPTIQVARNCFDGIWRNIVLAPTGNTNVVYISGAPKYRYRYDGTLEFKGNATYTVTFGAYSTGDRKQSAAVGPIPTNCLTLAEQSGQADLKNVNYIDTPQVSADQIVQQYGYIIKKNTANITIDFQSSFTATTSKTIVVNFDGAVSHPNL